MAAALSTLTGNTVTSTTKLFNGGNSGNDHSVYDLFVTGDGTTNDYVNYNGEYKWDGTKFTQQKN